MKPETEKAIQRCLKFKGGRSRPDKSFPLILPLLHAYVDNREDWKPADPYILDVGCGRGSAGIIIDAEFGRKTVLRPGECKIRVFHLVGVDIHDGYMEGDPEVGDDIYSNYFYESMHVCDYTERYKDFSGAIFLFVDVLEHFRREKAIEIIEWLKKRRMSRPDMRPVIIAAIPNAPKHWVQSHAFEAENPHEAHLHNWTNEEVMRDLGLRFVGENDGVGVFAHGV